MQGFIPDLLLDLKGVPLPLLYFVCSVHKSSLADFSLIVHLIALIEKIPNRIIFPMENTVSGKKNRDFSP